MSGLILKGNIASTTGEYLPAPYIDSIYIENSGSASSYKLQTSLFLGNYEDKVFYSNGAIENDEETYANNMGEINYYMMTLYNLEDTGFYDGILAGDINPFALYYYSGSAYTVDEAGVIAALLDEWNSTIEEYTNYIDFTTGGPDGEGYDATDSDHAAEEDALSTAVMLAAIAHSSPGAITPTSMNLTQIYPLSATPGSQFDESGNELLKYTITIEENLPDTLSPEATWESIKSMRVCVFSSIYDYFSNEDSFEDTEANNIPLLKMKISDISYENVFEGGYLGEKKNVKYVDSEEAIYEETPLVAIDMAPYRINKVTHNDIVEKFQELLDEYDVYYKKEKGFNKLKNMMDNVSTIIKTYGESENLLPQLHQLIKVFPDKTPSKPIGKFYKSFRKRVTVINKAIKNSTKLKRKVLYNSKIIDMRPTPAADAYVSAYAGSAPYSDYLYTNWSVSNFHTTFEGVASTTYNANVIFGHYFFDYEKALHQKSNISQIYDVSKLEKWNIPIPYNSYWVAETFVRRYSYSTEGGAYTITQEARLGTTLNEDQGYPRSEYTYGWDGWIGTTEPAKTLIIDPGEPLGGTIPNYPESPYYDWVTVTSPAGTEYTTPATPEAGYVSSLTYRHYLDPTRPGVGLKASSIDNYRLMCFELLDYQYNMPNDGQDGVNYWAYLFVRDKTYNMVKSLTSSCRTTLTAVENYYDSALELCVFNEEVYEFNQFFIDGATSAYEDDPASAPWYKGPLVYLMHQDLIYDTYGGDLDKLTQAAFEISQRIGPVTGTPYALEAFKDTFSDFIDSVYGATPSSEDGLYSPTISDMSDDSADDGATWRGYAVSLTAPSPTYDTD